MVRHYLERELDFILYEDEVIVKRETDGEDGYKVSINHNQYCQLLKNIDAQVVLKDKSEDEIRFITTGLKPEEKSVFDYANIEEGRL